MVCFGGLEFIAAGYLIAEHSKKKKKEELRRIEEEEEVLRQQAALQSSHHHHHHHHHHRRRRRHSDSEREDRRHRERIWAEAVPKKERKQIEDAQRPRKEKRREGEQDYRTSSPSQRHASPLPPKNRPYAGNPAMSSTHLNRPYPPPSSNALTTYLAPPQSHPGFVRAGSDPPPSNRIPHHAPPYQGHAMAPASHHNQLIPAHQQIHNSIFPPVPAELYRASPNPQRASPHQNVPAYPTYRPPSPASPPLPASALSSRPQYSTPPQVPASISLPPPPEGVWELPAGDMMHPNPARRPRASSAASRPHVHFADGLDVHENITDPPPPYREY